MEKIQKTRQSIFSELSKSTHRDLGSYVDAGVAASIQDPDFFAHLIAWNSKKGKVRDSKVALPLASMHYLVGERKSNRPVDPEYLENALAHLAFLRPRNLLQAVRFSKDKKLNGTRHALLSLVQRYVDNLQASPRKWEKTVVQHRLAVRELYALCHIAIPKDHFARDILFLGKRHKGNLLDKVANLKTASALEAAGDIASNRIPFIVASPAMVGGKIDNENVLVALLGVMTPTEVQNHIKMFKKRGANSPAVRGALEKALGRVAAAPGGAHRLTKAVEVLEELEDEDLKQKVLTIQEKKFDKTSIEGDWLLLIDRSGSMSAAITTGVGLAAALAKSAKGQVHMVFFDTAPQYFDATGKTLSQLKIMTKRIAAGGGTAPGVGLRYAIEQKLSIDGIAIISDGSERHSPLFCPSYKELSKVLDKEVPVYFYRVKGSDPDYLSGNLEGNHIEYQRFEVAETIDEYSVDNLTTSLRTSRYSLIDEVMETPLLTYAKVFTSESMHA